MFREELVCTIRGHSLPSSSVPFAVGTDNRQSYIHIHHCLLFGELPILYDCLYCMDLYPNCINRGSFVLRFDC